MRTVHTRAAFVALAIYQALAGSAPAAPLGTGFTYQGQLESGGNPLNGTADLTFMLFDAAGTGAPPTGGLQIGSTQTVSNVSVSGGQFTVTLNAAGEFGANPFNGEARWLQIAVRSPAGAGAFTTLSPRQPITATPYALQTRGIVVDSAGNAGIGTSAPVARLHAIAAGASPFNNTAVFEAPAIGQHASNVHFGTTGDWYIRSASDTGKVVLQDAGGRVMIGTTTPAFTGAKLAVEDVGVAIYGRAENGVVGQGTFSGVQAVGIGPGSGVRGIRLGSGFAGFFEGDVHVAGNLEVSGTVSKAGGSFKIDHPIDPENKYLLHSFVESPDMMNIYNGNVTTDANGDASITLPDWFEALNRDFRYQLTVIGQFAQAIVSKEIENNTFSIKTDKPSVKVSWQVTGIRQDAWANANRIPVEEDKAAEERGRYLHPEMFGQSKDFAVDPEKLRAAGAKSAAGSAHPHLGPGK